MSTTLRASGVATILLCSFGLGAIAETSDKDAPPPPGALLRELGTGPAGRPALDTAASTLGAPSPINAPIEIPFLLEGGHMLVEASINGGAKQIFLFDTGGRNLLTPDAARNVKSTHIRDGMIGGVGPDLVKATFVRLDRIAVGGLVMEQPTAIVADIPNRIVDRGAKQRLAGLIGPELIARRTVTIDYRKRLITLHPPGQARPAANAFITRLGFSLGPEGLGHPSVTATIGQTDAELVLDTGASGGLFLSEEFINTHRPFRTGSKVIRFLSPGGVGGTLMMQAGIGTTFRLGSETFQSPIIAGPASPGRDFRRSGIAHVSGLIGAQVLSRFIVTLDFPSSRAWFEPFAGPEPVTTWRSVGLVLDKPEPSRLEVIDVLPGTPAERAGIRRGDRIASFGGQPARNLGIRDFGNFQNKTVSIVMEDQRRHELPSVQILP